MQRRRPEEREAGPAPRPLPPGGRIAYMPPTALPDEEPPVLTDRDIRIAKAAAKRAEAEAQREARRRIKEAEASLKRMSRAERRGERRARRRERTVDRRLRRVEAAIRRPVWPLVATVLAFNATAAGLVVDHLLWPASFLYSGVLLPGTPQWELVLYLFAGSSLASGALLALSPTIDFQRRARSAMAMYLSIALLMSLIGLLIASPLQPLETLKVDLATPAWVLVVLVAATGLPAFVIWLMAGLRGSRLPFSRAYHVVMGVLLAIAVCALLMLPVFLVASAHMMVDVGISMTLAGAVGMFFPLPALIGTFVSEFVLERAPGASGA